MPPSPRLSDVLLDLLYQMLLLFKSQANKGRRGRFQLSQPWEPHYAILVILNTDFSASTASTAAT